LAKITQAEFASVDAYIAAQSEAAQAALNLVRVTLRKAMPEAEEVISYNMPTYTVNGARVLHFAGWKQHYSLYAASAAIVAAFGKELAGYKIQKGTISFPLSEPVPVRLIARIARFRAKEVAGQK
jgi:uncharacterized protein YdhG (YjbR/CyaY superfamily)